jgi:L-alanine-DL-glutamate epimerase-like enolase superfamily enzyme
VTSFTIGIDDLDVIAEKVREAEPYPILKVKVGTKNDEAILSTIRKVAPDKPLRVDANCGWTSANVVERCEALLQYDLEMIEQPTSPDDTNALPALRKKLTTPIVADESCKGIDTVLPCVGKFDGINIKLCKCGGIRPALKMIHTARSAGLKIMLGCMVETSVGIAAAAQLAPLVDWIDLDGHLLLADDPFEGIGGTQGRITLTNRPGLGVVER